MKMKTTNLQNNVFIWMYRNGDLMEKKKPWEKPGSVGGQFPASTAMWGPNGFDLGYLTGTQPVLSSVSISGKQEWATQGPSFHAACGPDPHSASARCGPDPGRNNVAIWLFYRITYMLLKNFD
ncbi:unnamed protein product [Leuciscus chuanchicus]